MTALEALARVSEQERTRRHQLAIRRAAVLKSTHRHNRDYEFGVPFLKKAIRRTRSADHVGDRPAISARQHLWRGTAWGTGRGAVRQSMFQFDRNFRQEFLSGRAV